MAVLLATAAEAADARPGCGGRKATMVGGGGDNVIKAPKHGVQVIYAGAGNDTIIAKRNKDVICGGPGDDVISGGTGRDKILGGAGNDLIDGGPGSDKMFGEGDNDTMIGGGGGDAARGSIGDDRLFGEIQDDHLFGDAGNDLVVGGHGIDELSGGPDNDWVRGDVNQDRYQGDAGTDTASFATATPPGPFPTQDGVSVNLATGTSQGDDSLESLSGFEAVVGSAFEDDLNGTGGTAEGNGGDDSCTGFSTASCGNISQAPPVAFIANPTSPDPGVVVLGGSGNDVLTVSVIGGAAVISGSLVNAGPGCTGGEGTLSCPSPGAEFGYVLLWGGDGNDSINVGGGLAQTTGVKGDGGPGDDLLNGGPAADILFPGQTGSDRLFGGAGDDAVVGRPGGGDSLNGGSGNDNLVSDDPCAGHVYDGGPGGADVAGFGHVDEAGGVRAQLGGGATSVGGGCSGSRILNSNEVLEGSRHSDILFGNGGADLIIGREGNDHLNGRAGRDELRGDSGADRCPDRTAIKISC
jgi:Ca2+-binding RTX toxin-like protein